MYHISKEKEKSEAHSVRDGLFELRLMMGISENKISEHLQICNVWWHGQKKKKSNNEKKSFYSFLSFFHHNKHNMAFKIKSAKIL